MPRPFRAFQSHGSGQARPEDFAAFGEGVVIEPSALVFHPENIRLGEGVYIGHQAILNGYHRGTLTIGDHSFIGPQCFLHGAGGIRIDAHVGIGPGVKIMTSSHAEEGRDVPILWSAIEMAPVVIETGCDIGAGAIILAGVHIGQGSQIGAGAVVTRHVEPFSVMIGAPARLLKKRP